MRIYGKETQLKNQIRNKAKQNFIGLIIWAWLYPINPQ